MRNRPFYKMYNFVFFFNIAKILFLVHAALEAESLLFAIAATTQAFAVFTTMVNEYYNERLDKLL
ncbi:hypothetical protein HMPREF3111_13335 [Proteus sp. HMSC10D02]|nr:hypothetical protein HMPREF3111_13335 [Proteus sp. HMSC10D02]